MCRGLPCAATIWTRISRPSWPNLTLARYLNENISRRLVALALAVLGHFSNRRSWPAPMCIVARNLTCLPWPSSPERLDARQSPSCDLRMPSRHTWCDDRHRCKRRLSRGVEPLLLWAYASLDIVSLSKFLTAYFEPVQGGGAQHTAGEQALGSRGIACPAPQPKGLRQCRCARRPWSVRSGLHGVDASLAPEPRIAFGSRQGTARSGFDLRFHGVVHAHALRQTFTMSSRAHPNISYAGPYACPTTFLPISHGIVDLVWSRYSWDNGGELNLAFADRIYEGNAFGCPSLAVDGTERGVAWRTGWGGLCPRRVPRASVDCLKALSPRRPIQTLAGAC